jgi:predicted PurR-regulated permease PerM
MRSRLFPLPSEPRWRRFFGLIVFLGALFAVRRLAILFVCFVLLSRGLDAAATFVERHSRVTRRRVLATLIGAAALLAGTLALVLVRRVAPFARRAQAEWRDWFDSIASNPAVMQLRDATGISIEGVTETLRSHALDAVQYANATAHVALYLMVGLIVAIMYLFEHDDLIAWRRSLQPGSIFDTLLRWFGYVADAIVVTARMQVVVAVVNAVVTMPVLFLLGLKHIGMLTLLILVSGLVPVVGNLISGAVLCIVAYESKGAWAVGVFVASTFVLHKIESYYLNPRLAAEHVRLPTLVLVTSLVLWEHFAGLPGLFLSFPALYVGSRIHHEWQEELAAEAGGAPATP